MMPLLLILTVVALLFLALGFFNIRIIPVEKSRRLYSSGRKLSKDMQKILRRKQWFDKVHKGFISLF